MMSVAIGCMRSGNSGSEQQVLDVLRYQVLKIGIQRAQPRFLQFFPLCIGRQRGRPLAERHQFFEESVARCFLLVDGGLVVGPGGAVVRVQGSKFRPIILCRDNAPRMTS